MKKVKGILGITALLLVMGFSMYSFSGCASFGDLAAGNPSITIENNTGYTIYYVYISETTSDSWGQDRLRSDQIISNGQSVSIQLTTPLSRVNKYDIRLLDSDGDEYTKFNVTVSNNSRIVFTKDDLDFPSITIVNNTGYTVYYVYISETTSDSWGSDRLRSDQVLSNGQSVSLELPHYIGVVNSYDFRLVDLDGDEYIKKNVTVKAGSRIEFTIGDIIWD